MKKFINHVDHVVYLSKWETIEANVAKLEAITDARMERCERQDMGCVLYIDWSAGLEMVAPLPQRTDLNRALYERLESHGEGLLAVVYGVGDLEAYKAKMEAKGFAIGPLMSGDPVEPWYNRLLLRERFAPQVMDSWMVLSQIDYKDDVIRFENVKEGTRTD
jgi:hypothetical protein